MILTGDMHIRDDQPVCRIDDYFVAQERKLRFIAKLAHKNLILDSGDVFNKWKPSPFLLAHALDVFKHAQTKIIGVAGNHDLPQHNIELFDKCGLAVLKQAGIWEPPNEMPYWSGGHSTDLEIHHFNWNDEIKPSQRKKKTKRRIAIMHVMTYKGKQPPYPGCAADNASKLLKKMQGYDLVLTGDNHITFVVEDKGRLLVNPGSMMRMTVAQIDHKPCVFKYDVDDNTVEQVFLPIEKGVVDRGHIEIREDKDQRMEAFIKHLKGDYEIGLNFIKNMEAHIANNKVSKPVQNIIWEAIEDEG